MIPLPGSSQTVPAIAKSRQRAIALALAGIVLPGLHKFYLREWAWGVVYLVLSPTYISQVASLVEALWYLSLKPDEFDCNFNNSGNASSSIAQHVDAVSTPLRDSFDQWGGTLNQAPRSLLESSSNPPQRQADTTVTATSANLQPEQVKAIAAAVRELEQLRQEGLISEYEFEQKRRQWLDRMG